MFESIKGALASTEKSGGNILRTEPGNTYTVRILPLATDPGKTFFHYFQHGWNSFADGQYVAAVSPQTFGDRDPIAEARYKLYRGNDAEKAQAAIIYRSEKWLVNAYIVNDPVTPDNNGKVMLLRYGKQLHKVIESAIDGEDAGDLGARVFDLGSDGVNLKIIVEKQGDFPTYVSSKFAFPSEIPGMTEEKAEGIYKEAQPLDTILTIKSYDELKKMVDDHITLVSTDDTPTPPVVPPAAAPAAAAPAAAAPTPPVNEGGSNASVGGEDENIKNLLDGLDV